MAAVPPARPTVTLRREARGRAGRGRSHASRAFAACHRPAFDRFISCRRIRRESGVVDLRPMSQARGKSARARRITRRAKRSLGVPGLGRPRDCCASVSRSGLTDWRGHHAPWARLLAPIRPLDRLGALRCDRASPGQARPQTGESQDRCRYAWSAQGQAVLRQFYRWPHASTITESAIHRSLCSS